MTKYDKELDTRTREYEKATAPLAKTAKTRPARRESEAPPQRKR